MVYPRYSFARGAILSAVAAVLVSCVSRTANSTGANGFSSLLEEQAFWNQWRKDHDDDMRRLEPFYTDGNKVALESIDARLSVIAKAPEDFLVIVRTNSNNGVFSIVALTKGSKGGWKQVSWNVTDASVLKESVIPIVKVQEDALRRITAEAVYVDAMDWNVHDGDSIYGFIRYEGRCSRFATYNPKHQANNGPLQHSVANSLGLLLKSVGVPVGE
jgi:hypothetical protein